MTNCAGSWICSKSSLLLLLSLFSIQLFCQGQVDSAATEQPADTIPLTREEMKQQHSPGRAALYSAVVPGLGQAYNEKYWKIPIVYAGFIISGYFLDDNLKNIRYFKQQYENAFDDDPNTINNSQYGTGQLVDVIDLYKRWRDFSYIAMGAVYILNVVDAYVDAHLFYFDVSEDISFHVTPSFIPSAHPTTGLSLCLKL